jgi:hypothetical protein
MRRFAILVVLLLTATVAAASVPPPPPAGATCSDFQVGIPFPQTFPGPTFTLGGLAFTNPTSGGVPVAMQFVDRTEDRDGRPELFIGSSLSGAGRTPLLLTFTPDPTTVWIDLMHFNRATVMGVDAAGAVVASATQPTQRLRAFLVLTSPRRIHTVRFEAVETLLYRVCWR